MNIRTQDKKTPSGSSSRPSLRSGRDLRGSPRSGLLNGLAKFAVPAYIMVGVFFFVPQILNFYFAFTKWTTYSSTISWNGLDNLRLLMEQGSLLHPVVVTVLYAVIAMIIQNVVGLCLAYALRDSTRVNGFFRTVFFIPVLISPIAVGYIWRGLLKPDGPVNDFIGLVVPNFDWAWLGEPATALAAVAFMDAWKWIGLTTVVYIAGINAVPFDVLEAARLDGASAWVSFWKITFPLLAPAFTFNVVSTLVGAFSAYDVIQASTGGGPGDSTRTLYVELRMQWAQGNFGTGSALGLTVTLLVVVVAVPLVWYLRRRELRA